MEARAGDSVPCSSIVHSDTSSSQALTQQSQSFLRTETANKSLAGSREYSLIYSQRAPPLSSHLPPQYAATPREISPIPELLPTAPPIPPDPRVILAEIAIERSRISLSEAVMEDAPVPPGSVGRTLFLSRITDEMRQTRRDQIFTVTREDLIDVTNRDPNSMDTLYTFDQSVDWAANGGFSEDDVEEAKLSVFKSLDAPVPPGSVGRTLFLSRITDDMRQTRRDQIFTVTREDLIDVTNRYLTEGERAASSSFIGPAHDAVRENNKWRIVIS